MSCGASIATSTGLHLRCILDDDHEGSCLPELPRGVAGLVVADWSTASEAEFVGHLLAIVESAGDTLTFLEAINISDTAITDAGLAQIEPLAGIMGLNLSGTKITDAGLEHLKYMGHLTKLDLSRTAVTEAGVAQAKKTFLPSFVRITR